MKKRIFSLAMVCLFILTALGATVAFAEDETVTSTVVMGEQTAIKAADFSDAVVREYYKGEGIITMATKNTHYATYNVDVKQAGKYEVSMYFTYIQNVDYQLNVYVDDTLACTMKKLPATDKGTYSLGLVDLTTDTKTIKIEQAGYYAAMMQYVYIDVANQIGDEKVELGVGHATSYEATNAYLTSNSKTGEYISTEGLLDMGPSKYIIYDIYVKEKGNYAISMYSGELGQNIKWKIAVDETEKFAGGYIPKDDVHNADHAAKNYLQVMELTEGLHTIKVTVSEGTLRFFGLCIEEPVGTPVSYTEETRLSANDDVAYTNGTKTADNATSGVTNTDGRLVMHYNKSAYFIVDVETAGTYNISIVAGAEANKSISVITDGGTVTTTFKPTEASVTYGTEYKLATVDLNAGPQLIGIKSNNDSFYLYGISIVNAAHMLSTRDKVTVSAVEFSSKVTSQEEVWPNDSSTDGIITTGLVVVRNGYSYTYTLNVPETGNYALSTVSGGVAIYGTVTDKNGNILYDGMIADSSPENALSYAAETNTGVITLHKGICEITINASSASTYLYSLCFKYIAPSVEVYEGEIADEMYAYDVTSGTMSVKVELNGYLTGRDALVVFAVYETDARGIKRLYKVYAETVAGGNATVTGAVNDIVIDDEKTYTVKVFMLDNETLIGKVINYIQ